MQLSPDQKEQVIEVLSSIEFTPDPEGDTVDAIAKSLNCSNQDATAIFNEIRERIECVSESGGVHAEPWPKWKMTSWKWRKK